MGTELLLIPSLLLNIILILNQRIAVPTTMVEGVIDGDTLVLEGKVRLRLRHVDAPELAFCAGEEAKDFLAKLVTSKKVAITDQVIDQQGRAMALVYVGKTLVNKELLAAGLGRYHADTTDQKAELKATGDKAKAKSLGLWAPECYQKEVSMQKPECVIKGNIDKVSHTKIYYLPNCAQYNFTIVERDTGEEWFCNEAEAQEAGYVKSKNCADAEAKEWAERGQKS